MAASETAAEPTLPHTRALRAALAGVILGKPEPARDNPNRRRRPLVFPGKRGGVR